MEKRIILMISLALCLLLCACSSSASTEGATAPSELEVAVEISAAELPRLSKEEMQTLASQLDVEKLVGDLEYANSMVNNVYTFDGVIQSIGTDHLTVQFTSMDGTSTGIAAKVFLLPEELKSVVPMQKVTFVGRADDVIADGVIFYSAAIVSDRFKYYGEIKEKNPEYEPNTWNLQFTSTDIRAVTFSQPIDRFIGESYHYSYKEIDGRYVDAYLLGPNGELVSYDPILFNWPDIIEMKQPKLTLTEVQEMIDQDLTLDDVAERIDTLADLVQYLHLKGFVFGNRDIQFRYGVCKWSVSHSPENVFKDNMGDCGGGSNLANYILRGDFEEQGYFYLQWNQMGHITNYFKQDGKYYFFDLSMITAREYQNTDRYAMFITDDPQKYADYLVERNHRCYDAESPDYLLQLIMYAYEGKRLPCGFGTFKQGRPSAYYLPKQHEEIIHILYAEGVGVPVFAEAPEQNLWPEMAR